MKQLKFYTCYSINLLRWIKAYNLKPITKYIDKKTNRTCWVFAVNEQLEEALTCWTKQKEEAKAKGII